MFTGTDSEYRKAVAKTNELGAQIGDLLRQIEQLGVGIVTTRGNGQIIGPTFTLRRVGDNWIFHT
jgi:hypothetical protein